MHRLQTGLWRYGRRETKVRLREMRWEEGYQGGVEEKVIRIEELRRNLMRLGCERRRASKVRIKGTILTTDATPIPLTTLFTPCALYDTLPGSQNGEANYEKEVDWWVGGCRCGRVCVWLYGCVHVFVDVLVRRSENVGHY